MTDSPLTGWGQPSGALALQPFNIHSINFEPARIVKSGPGVLYGFTAYNSDSAATFIQVFDTNVLPDDGTSPVAVFACPATENIGVQWLPGRTFTTGCVLVNSSTPDTLTAGTSTIWFDCQYL